MRLWKKILDVEERAKQATDPSAVLVFADGARL
jgi:hypothetical protein